MFDLAFLVGALVPTGLLSALFVWVFGRFRLNIVARALGANVLALLVAIVIGAYGFADGGPPKFEAAFTNYLLPQIVWTVLWLFILRGRKAQKEQG